VGAPSQTKPGNNVDVVANLLQHRHKGRFMVWNLSEETYDYAKFQDQVCFGFCDL
jgi:tensin